MEERFAVRETHDLETCKVLIRVLLTQWDRIRPWIWIAIAAAFLYFAIARASVVYAIVFAMDVFFAGQFFHYNRIGRARRLHRALRVPSREIFYRFGDDAVRSTDEFEKTEASYRSYVRFAECRGYYLLFVGPAAAVILKKSGFTVGNPDDFPAFIFEKTGLKLERVK